VEERITVVIGFSFHLLKKNRYELIGISTVPGSPPTPKTCPHPNLWNLSMLHYFRNEFLADKNNLRILR